MYEERRDTARKTLLLERISPMEIQYPEKFQQKSGWKKLKNTLFKQKAAVKEKKIFVSEQQRTYARIYDKCFFLSTQDSQKAAWRRRIDKFDKDQPVYEPQMLSLLPWYLLVMIFIFYHLFQIPLVIFFGDVVYKAQFSNLWSILVNYFTIVILIVDSLLKLNTGYYVEGLLVTKRRKILGNYLRLEMWLDMISLTVLIIYIAAGYSRLIYLKMFFYLKVYEVVCYDRQVQRIIELNTITLAVYRLLRVIVIFLIYSHWMACGFFAIDYYLYYNNSFYFDANYLWLTGSAALPGCDMVTTYSWYIWYEYALYWALQTATTVGYGDLTPKNPQEVLYTIINMLAMCVMFAYFINSVWEILSDMNVKSNRYKNNFHVLNRFLNNKQVTTSLRQKLRAYLDYLWRQDTVEEVQQLILNKLTPTLKDELAVNIKYPFFLKIKLFSLLNDARQFQSFKKQLAHTLKQQRYSQQESIFTDGDIDNRLFYVLDGKVRIGLRDFDSKGLISTSQNFGQLEFVTGLGRLASATAVRYSHVYYLDRETFVQTLKKHPQIYQLFLKYQDLVKIQKQYEIISLFCFNCFQSHSFVECPSLHYFPVFKYHVEYSVNKAQNSRQSDYKRYDLRKFKLLMPKPKAKFEQFETLSDYTWYFPEFNISNIRNALIKGQRLSYRKTTKHY